MEYTSSKICKDESKWKSICLTDSASNMKVADPYIQQSMA